MSDLSIIESLELQLAKLANEWRRTHSQGHYAQSESILKTYHEVMDKLWELGWDGTGLLPDSELPREFMPEYFNKKWDE